MTRGCRVNDYFVFIGSELCRNFDLTDNLLKCRPPKSEPRTTFNDSFYCDHSLAINVTSFTANRFKKLALVLLYTSKTRQIHSDY